MPFAQLGQARLRHAWVVSGKTAVFSGPSRLIEVGTLSRVGQQSVPNPIEPAWLFGRKTRTLN